MEMSVTPIVCETVAEELACGSRTLGACAKAAEAANATVKVETTKRETCLLEIIFGFPLYCGMWRALCNALRALSMERTLNLQLFTNPVRQFSPFSLWEKGRG